MFKIIKIIIKIIKILIIRTPKYQLLVYLAQLYSRELQVDFGFFGVYVKSFNFILTVLRTHIGYSPKCVHLRIRTKNAKKERSIWTGLRLKPQQN